jgi:hypothetical protein
LKCGRESEVAKEKFEVAKVDLEVAQEKVDVAKGNRAGRMRMAKLGK